MTLQPSAFQNDLLTISWWELIKLFFGAKLKAGALVVRVGKNQPEQPT